MVTNWLPTYRLNQVKHIAPLATFRVAFGVMMLASIIRFWSNGWIAKQYIEPEFYFPYFGFEWIQTFGDPGMYLLFAAMGVAALGIALGAFYRWSAILFFLSFTYVELIDKTNYLNHYYFVSIIAFLLILVPANKAYSIDAWRRKKQELYVPAWSIHIIILQLSLVYFFAGLAKLQPDWLLEALPLKIWLPSRANTPIIGFLLDYKWTAYLFSWFGAFYDLTIPFFLLWKRTRVIAYLTVIAFHFMTAALFQIGMFPYIMVVSTLIFFSEDFHQRLWKRIFPEIASSIPERSKLSNSSILKYFFIVYFALQILLPFRFALYPGKLFWTEQGYRFSWRVMLMEKVGYTQFTVSIPEQNRSFEVLPNQFLTPVQEKMMNTQPDMILQFSHFLRDKYESETDKEVEIYVQSYATINGKGSRPFIDPNVDLASMKRGYQHKNWVLPYTK
ncbi:Vitamin K-dependent gamma-carboxylase [Marivirga sericea]|uniref:Vitamin K-dependent gamma-carboxylase n=1 Tax=Marivirga sericea TaxID=1028 RepID=A0A1X7LJG7_9BACT|nr:HTTM domain-containing protein [Marivirga sericea]SMG53687.1 Vitamin K-dependent gamma-carboxylase [Marivirga sericea]